MKQTKRVDLIVPYLRLLIGAGQVDLPDVIMCPSQEIRSVIYINVKTILFYEKNPPGR